MQRVGAIIAVIVAVCVFTAGTAAATDRVRPPGPPRVLLVGDSLTFQYQDEAAVLLAAKGYQVTRFGVPTTGLLDAAWCHGQVAKVLGRSQPDVVVYEQVGNYRAGTTMNPPCSEKVAWATPGFYKQWTRSAKLTQRILTRRGARFLWVAMPPVTRPGYATVTPRITAINRTLGPVIETWPTYTPAYHYDGLHLTQAGQDRLAALVAKAVTG